MSAIVCALDLNDNETTIAVQAKQINATLGVLPLAELFRQNQRVWRNRVNMFTQDPLNVIPLLESE